MHSLLYTADIESGNAWGECLTTATSFAMSSTAPTCSSSPRTSPIQYLPISGAAIDACAAICHHSFNHFNRSVALPPESACVEGSRDLIVTRIRRPTSFHLMAARQTADSGVEHWVDGVGEVVGLVIMDTADEAAGLGPLVVSRSVQSGGVGRALMERCIDEARQRRIRSLRLIAIVANIASFSLYHSLGFRAHDYMVAVQGHITAAHHQQLSGEMRAAGVDIRPMARDDIAACNQLHIATNSYSRLAGLTFSFESQPSQQKSKGDDERLNGAADVPTVGCYVAVRSGGAIVGYCTGWVKSSH